MLTHFIVGAIVGLLSAPHTHAKELTLAQLKPPELKDLGFEEAHTQANPIEADQLRTRTRKLQRHQVMALTTLGLFAATVFTGPEGEKPSTLHKGLGIATALSYGYTAYLSLSAPEVGPERPGWGLRVHKTMMWIHLPGMILTPIAGLLAEEAYESGKKPSGLGKYKKELAYTTAAALGLAALSITFEF